MSVLHGPRIWLHGLPGCCALTRSKPMTTITPAASKPIINIEASSSPKPRCDASAASPRPAARPATGPIHEREGAAAAAVPAAGAAAAVCAGALSGAAWRWVPSDLPDPMRLAASASRATVVKPNAKTTDNNNKSFFTSISKQQGSRDDLLLYRH